MSTAKPTPHQVAFQDWEFGVFLHFGIRTFYEGHRDWDGKPMMASAFNPTQLDCRQWVKIAKEAGAKYMVFTTKHHDGFANWPSHYTEFSVVNSPWKNGKGDVVREFIDACHEGNMHVGLYYSPADVSCPVYNDHKAYDDYFVNQISELLTGYGEVDLLWFDGCGSEGHSYDWAWIIHEIRTMQPNILIFNMGDPDYRWVGNEEGLAPSPIWNTMEQLPVSVQTLHKESLEQIRWLPVECDCRMRELNWFYSDADEHTVKSLEELMGIYYYSVGRGCNLILNIGPDRHGLLPSKDAARLLEFGQEIRRRFSRPLPLCPGNRQEGNSFFYELPEPYLVNRAVLQENLKEGEHVRRFTLKVFPLHSGEPITVYEGRNIGHKAICQFPSVRTKKIILEIVESDEPVTLRSAQFYN